MSVIVLLVLFSLLLALAFLGAFIISMRSGQFDDTSTPQFRMLFDTPPPVIDKEEKKKS
jgi:cbb3-type cytochrome oxidase maturation protein